MLSYLHLLRARESPVELVRESPIELEERAEVLEESDAEVANNDPNDNIENEVSEKAVDDEYKFKCKASKRCRSKFKTERGLKNHQDLCHFSEKSSSVKSVERPFLGSRC